LSVTSKLDRNTPTRFDAALQAFSPDRFGFMRHRHGWLAEFAQIGTVAFAPLAWPHNQSPSYDVRDDRHVPTNALGMLVRLQQEVWGIPPEEAVPVNVLSILEDTGGAVLVAYELSKGFNADGWLGFAAGFGTRSGPMYSHLLGVREERRGSLDLGWHLKILQGYLALKSGHDSMTWTFDPMRGANARLNIEKLGATMVNLTIDKYGALRSSLYGDVPTDRFTAHWDLASPVVHKRIEQISVQAYAPLGLEAVSSLPEATRESVDELKRSLKTPVCYRIPGDIDLLMRADPDRAIRWRQEMRLVLGTLMTRKQAHVDDRAEIEGPIAVGTSIDQGNYEVTGFATGFGSSGERESFYILERKGTP
jgi:chorismate synthase